MPYDLPDDLWPVEVDPDQISQVVQNLVVNAREAMEGGGLIENSARNAVLGPQNNFGINKGRYAVLEVKDYGIGIPEENKSKIFDLFFTTKETGTGFGLATSYSIVHNHGGAIHVDSEVNKETTFSVFLPASTKELVTQTKQKDLIRGEGTVLLMDDEKSVKRVGGRMFQQLGYQCTIASTGHETLSIYAKQQFDVVILDLTVPGGMSGIEVARKIKETNPDAKLILSSGYGQKDIFGKEAQNLFDAFLQKPYTLQQLSELLHSLK